MAKYRITGPDGSTYEITAPEGASEQEIMSFVQSQIGGNDFAARAAGMSPTALSVARAKNDPFGEYLRNQAMQPRAGETQDEQFSRLYGSLPSERRPGYGEGISRALVQGGMFGGGDEFVAAGAAALDPIFKPGDRGTYGERYGAYLGRERERLGQFREDAPVTAFGSEVAGALPTAALPVVRGMQAAQGAGVAARMGAGALTGAGQGGLYGYLAGEGDGRVDNAMFGAAVGGVAGAVAPPAIDFAAKTLRYLGDQTIGRMGGQRQATAALRKLSQAFMRDGLTPEQAAQKLNQMGPEAALMDLGPNTRALAASTSRAPGAGKTIIDDFVTPRQEGARNAMNVLEGGQINRINQSLDDLIPGRYTMTQRGALETARSNAARPLYDATVNRADALIPDQQFQQLAGDEFLAREFAKVRRDPLFGLKDLPENSLQVLDAAKRSIDDQISAARRAGNNNAARMLMQKKDALVSVADDVFPGYAQARQVWSEYSGVIDAGDLGRKFMSGDVDVVANAVKRMSPEEQAQFRLGAAQAIRDKIGGLVNRADATKRISDIPALEQKIRIAFGDDDIFRRYIDMTRAERAMFDSYAAVRGGSQTAERLAADADAAIDPGAAAEAIARLTGNPLSFANIVNAARTFGGKAASRAQTPEPVRRELAKLLVGRSTNQLDDAIAAQMASEEGRRNLARILTTTGAVSGGRQ